MNTNWQGQACDPSLTGLWTPIVKHLNEVCDVIKIKSCHRQAIICWYKKEWTKDFEEFVEETLAHMKSPELGGWKCCKGSASSKPPLGFSGTMSKGLYHVRKTKTQLKATVFLMKRLQPLVRWCCPGTWVVHRNFIVLKMLIILNLISLIVKLWSMQGISMLSGFRLPQRTGVCIEWGRLVHSEKWTRPRTNVTCVKK